MLKKEKNSIVNAAVIKHLIITALTGCAFWIVGELLFSILTDKLWTPLGIAIYFLIFAIIISVVFFFIMASKTNISKEETKRNIKDEYAIGAIIMAAVILFAGLFEFLYELGGRDTYEPTSYIFLVDDSGSMGGTEETRVNAIREVMENSDVQKPYAVYKFSDTAEQIVPMKNYDYNDYNDYIFLSEGGTEILGSIEYVLDDFANGRLNNAGSAPKIILMSDGGSSGIGLNKIAKKCKENGISVSTIGVEGSSEGLLKKIASKTGGIYVKCTDVANLSESFEKAKAINMDRNLLSERFVYKYDGLYAFLRIAFLVILGVAWSFAKNFMTREESSVFKKSVIISIICCVVSVFVLEFLAGSFLDIRILRLIFCVLWAVTYGTANISKKSGNPIYATGSQNQMGNKFPDGKGKTDMIGSGTTNNEKIQSLSGGYSIGTTGNQQSQSSQNPLGSGSINPLGGGAVNPLGSNTVNPLSGGAVNPLNNKSSSNPMK